MDPLMPLFVFVSLLLTAQTVAPSSVLDLDGNELRRGERYYAVSVLRPGGGLTLEASPDESSCPLHVTQASFNDLNGMPLAFFPEDPDEDTVREGRTLNVMFPQPTECPQSTVWALDREDNTGVTTGGSKSSSIGPHYSRFAIRKVTGSSLPGYQFQVCPCSIGAPRPSCRMGCMGPLSFASNGRPHTVMFAKVKEEGMVAMH